MLQAATYVNCFYSFWVLPSLMLLNSLEKKLLIPPPPPTKAPSVHWLLCHFLCSSYLLFACFLRLGLCPACYSLVFVLCAQDTSWGLPPVRPQLAPKLASCTHGHKPYSFSYINIITSLDPLGKMRENFGTTIKQIVICYLNQNTLQRD